MVEGGGFEPPKSTTSDLQSDPFGHSGTPPGDIQLLLCPVCSQGLSLIADGAGDRNRTRNLLITSQLLYQLSYASTNGDLYTSTRQNARLFLPQKRAVQRVQTYNLFASRCQPGIFVFSESNRPVASYSCSVRPDRNLPTLSSLLMLRLAMLNNHWPSRQKNLLRPLDIPDRFCHI
jgi:hypothetical protein